MADTYKQLGQSKPAAGTATTLYTVPASTAVIVSTITACNQSATMDFIRIWFPINGAGDAAEQYAHYDLPILGNDTFNRTAGDTLGAGDLIRVQSQNGTTSFLASGVEKT